MTERPPLVVEQGSLICYRQFDLGNEILLDRAERNLTAGDRSRRWELSRSNAQSLAIKVPPLDLQLSPQTIPFASGPREAAVTARFFQHGVASLRFELEIPSETPLASLASLRGEVEDSDALEAAAKTTLDGLLARLGNAVQGGPAWEDLEDYTIAFIQKLAGHPTSEQVLADRQTLCALLTGETYPRPVVEAEQLELIRDAYSFLDDDLVVINWDCALVFEPSGSRDVPDVLEFACAQLTGLRGYDALLDRDLARIYEELERAGHGQRGLFYNPTAQLAREVQERWIGITEFTERTVNAIKVVGDLYLARVYRAALERFRVGEWERTVERKQARVAKVYDFIKSEVDARRLVVLEAMIVLLIVAEIVLSLVK